DIDHFKHINDEHGHAAGDLVLKQFAEILREAVRDSDTAVRWGGEEFLVVARNVARRESSVLVERIRANVAAHAFDIGEGKTLHATCSLGFTTFPFCSDETSLFGWDQVVDFADRALYTAKRSGRNAWVGFYPADQATLQRLKEGLPTAILPLMQEGHLDVFTSLPGIDALNWDQEK
ncbi:MAG: GGDEF domain-containing protein, partial [Holophaga sp.]|nr:GGDEF domain-containing protein [Holophaga sp.]